MLSLFKWFWFLVLVPVLAWFAVEPGTASAATDRDDDPEGDGDGDGAGGQGEGDDPPTGEEAKFTQADVDRIIKERLERQQKKAEAQTKKAKEEAEAQALADQEEWQKLAEKNGAKAAEVTTQLDEATEQLEAATKQIEKLEATLKEQLKAAKEGVPEYILEIVNKLPLNEQMGYLTKHRESIAGKQPGAVPPTPKPNGNLGEVDEKAAREQVAKTYQSQF